MPLVKIKPPKKKTYPELSFVDASKMTRQVWLEERMYGLGGSDVSTITGMNMKYGSKLELFHQKLGRAPRGGDHTIATMMGTVMEDNILELGQYYDIHANDPEEQLIKNWSNGYKVRDIVKFPYMVRNSNHPWSLANLDGLEDYNPVTQKAKRIAECKTISRQSAEMWVGKLPPYYLMQAHHYMITLEPMLERLETYIYVLEDGRYLYALPVEKSPTLWNIVIEECSEFWETLQKGREIIANASSPEQEERGLWEIEPPADSSKRYEEFLSENYLNKLERIEITGSDELYNIGVQYQDLTKQIKEMEGDKQLLRNQILNEMKRSGTTVFTFPNGNITYSSNKLYVKC